MSGNPPLIRLGDSEIPQLYHREVLAIRRDEIDIEVDNVPLLQSNLDGTRNHNDIQIASYEWTHSLWKARGTIYLSNLRLVFVAAQQDQQTGLRAFELPLAFIHRTKFNQPIFFCNNLSGQAWSALEDGSPDEASPPLAWVAYFKNGGVGTFLPLYFQLQEHACRAYQHLRTNPPDSHSFATNDIQSHVATAIVDPSDPSTLYLTQPKEVERIPSAPVYAPNYGDDEAYEPL